MTARKKTKPRPKGKAKPKSVATKKLPALFSGSNVQPKKPEGQSTREQAQRDKNAAVLAYIAPMTIAVHERQDAQDRRNVERFEDEPMTSAPVWHVHQK